MAGAAVKEETAAAAATATAADDVDDESKRPRRFDDLGAAPVLLPGLVSDWPALTLWRRKNIESSDDDDDDDDDDVSYERLRSLVGDATVEAMASADDVFTGDMRNHNPLTLTLSELLNHAKNTPTTNRKKRSRGDESELNERCCVYLAQAPLWTAEGARAAAAAGAGDDVHGVSSARRQYPLTPLMADVPVPTLLSPLTNGFEDLSGATTTTTTTTPTTPPPPPPETGGMHSINLWLSLQGSRSSLHFDDYNNVLCVARGGKRVSLWPLSCTDRLYPHPLGGDSSNHSRVDASLSSPHAQTSSTRYPLFAHAEAHKSVYELAPGDALYIPEGWWHRVDSDPHTAAVNFWWESAFTRGLGGHMDGYYARKAMESLVASERKRAMTAFRREAARRWAEYMNARARGGAAAPADPAAPAAAASDGDGEKKKKVDVLACVDALVTGDEAAAASRLLECFLGVLSPGEARRLLLLLAERHPTTLTRLLRRRSLSPIAAELLTAQFEAADAADAPERSRGFYLAFYGAFTGGEDREFFSALLDRKEEFSTALLDAACRGFLYSSSSSSSPSLPGPHVVIM